MMQRIMLLDYSVADDGVRARVLVTAASGSAVQLTAHVHPSEALRAALVPAEEAIKHQIGLRFLDLIGDPGLRGG